MLFFYIRAGIQPFATWIELTFLSIIWKLYSDTQSYPGTTAFKEYLSTFGDVVYTDYYVSGIRVTTQAL